VYFCSCQLILNPKQVDLSMLFPEPVVAEGHPTNPTPVFLSGEKKQAVRTSTLIPPRETVEKVKKEINRVQLQNYLYATSYFSNMMKLTPSRSKYSIELSQDLDDAAVSLLVDNGLQRRFPAACDAWKTRNANSKEISQKSISENRQLVDKELKDGQPLLEDTLAREITRKILDAYPYVLLFKFHLTKNDFDPSIVYLTQGSSSLKIKAWTWRMLCQVEISYSLFPKSNCWHQTPPAL